MAEKLIAKLCNQGRSCILLEVRESNLSGQQFFRALGFRATEILSGFYTDSDEDAYVMRYRLGDEGQRYFPVNRIMTKLSG